MSSAPVARTHNGAPNRREGMVRRKSSRRRIQSKQQTEAYKHHHHHVANNTGPSPHESENLFSTSILSETSSSRQEHGQSETVRLPASRPESEMDATHQNISSKSSRSKKHSQSLKQSTSKRSATRPRQQHGASQRSHSMRSLDNSMSTSKLSQEEEAWKGISDVLNDDGESVATKDVLPEGIANALGHSTSGESIEQNGARFPDPRHTQTSSTHNSLQDENSEEDMDYDEAAKQLCGVQSSKNDSKDMPSLMNSSFSSLNSDATDLKSTISEVASSHNRVVHQNTSTGNGLDPLKQYLLGVTSSLQGQQQVNERRRNDEPDHLQQSFPSLQSDATDSKSILSFVSRSNKIDVSSKEHQSGDAPMHNFLVGITTALQKKQQSGDLKNTANVHSTAFNGNEQSPNQSRYDSKKQFKSHSSQSPSTEKNEQQHWTAASASSPPPSGKISMIKKKKSPRERSISNPGPEISQSLSSLPLDGPQQEDEFFSSSMPSLATFREDDIDENQKNPTGNTRNVALSGENLLGGRDDDSEELELVEDEKYWSPSQRTQDNEHSRPPKSATSPNSRSPTRSPNMKAQRPPNQRGPHGRSTKERPKLSQSNSQRSPQKTSEQDRHRGSAGISSTPTPQQQRRRSSTGGSSHSGTAQQRRRSSTGTTSRAGLSQQRRRSSTGTTSSAGRSQQRRRSSTGTNSSTGLSQQRRRSSNGTDSSAGLSQQRRRSSTGTNASSGTPQQRRRGSNGDGVRSGNPSRPSTQRGPSNQARIESNGSNGNKIDRQHQIRRGSGAGNSKPPARRTSKDVQGHVQQNRKSPYNSGHEKVARRGPQDRLDSRADERPTSSRPYHSDHVRKKKESTFKRASAPPGANSALMAAKSPTSAHSDSAFGDHFFNATFSDQGEGTTPSGAFDSFFPEEPIPDHGTGQVRKSSIIGASSSPNRFKIKNPFRSSGSKKAGKGRDDGRFYPDSDEDDQLGALMYN